MRRVYHEVEARQDAMQIVTKTGESQRRGNTQTSGFALQPLAQRTPAEYQQPRRRRRRQYIRPRGKKIGMPLARDKLRDDADALVLRT